MTVMGVHKELRRGEGEDSTEHRQFMVCLWRMLEMRRQRSGGNEANERLYQMLKHRMWQGSYSAVDKPVLTDAAARYIISLQQGSV